MILLPISVKESWQKLRIGGRGSGWHLHVQNKSTSYIILHQLARFVPEVVSVVEPHAKDLPLGKFVGISLRPSSLIRDWTKGDFLPSWFSFPVTNYMYANGITGNNISSISLRYQLCSNLFISLMTALSVHTMHLNVTYFFSRKSSPKKGHFVQYLINYVTLPSICLNLRRPLLFATSPFWGFAFKRFSGKGQALDWIANGSTRFADKRSGHALPGVRWIVKRPWNAAPRTP